MATPKEKGWVVPEKLPWNQTPRDEWALELAATLEVGDTDFKWDGNVLVLAFKGTDGQVTIWDTTINRIWR